MPYSHAVMANVVKCALLVRKFEFKSFYRIHILNYILLYSQLCVYK